MLWCFAQDNTGFDLKQLFIGAEGTLGEAFPFLSRAPVSKLTEDRLDSGSPNGTIEFELRDLFDYTEQE